MVTTSGPAWGLSAVLVGFTLAVAIPAGKTNMRPRSQAAPADVAAVPDSARRGVELIRLGRGTARVRATSDAEIEVVSGTVFWHVRHRTYRLGPMAESEKVAGTPVHPSKWSSRYGWPIKPFDRQHPVRGFLNDPRIASDGSTFHFGIDIAAPDGTGVHAVEAGTAYLKHPNALVVLSSGGGRAFEYWHVTPVVSSHQFVRAGQLLGHIQRTWGHVHFAERRGSVYLNPLRAGALTPYVDHQPPTIAEIWLRPEERASVTRLDLDVSAFDLPQPYVPGPWRDEPVSPALLRWRVAGERTVGPWQTVVDFRWSTLPNSMIGNVYAAATRQNHAAQPGVYYFHVSSSWSLAALRNGQHTLQLLAEDTRGNRAFAAVPIFLSPRGF